MGTYNLGFFILMDIIRKEYDIPDPGVGEGYIDVAEDYTAGLDLKPREREEKYGLMIHEYEDVKQSHDDSRKNRIDHRVD
jgi:hypothetical protein